MNRGAKVILGVIAMVMATVIGANVYLVVRATRDPSFAVEEDYYRRAVAWDAELDARRASEALGWSASLQADRSGLSLEVRDREGVPVRGATARAEVFHSARAAERFRAALVESGEGRYVLSRPLVPDGLWVARASFEREGDIFQVTLEGKVR